jgi:hypothetical protein
MLGFPGRPSSRLEKLNQRDKPNKLTVGLVTVFSACNFGKYL